MLWKLLLLFTKVWIRCISKAKIWLQMACICEKINLLDVTILQQCTTNKKTAPQQKLVHSGYRAMSNSQSQNWQLHELRMCSSSVVLSYINDSCRLEILHNGIYPNFVIWASTAKLWEVGLLLNKARACALDIPSPPNMKLIFLFPSVCQVWW